MPKAAANLSFGVISMKTIPIVDDAQWHTLRRQHVGGSEVAALFGEHAQVSKFELWNRKRGTVAEPDVSGSERVFWGSVLEPAIAEGVRLKTGWKVNKVHRYHSMLPDLGLGGSLDYEVVGHERGPGVLEIKTADWLIVRGWEDGEPPLSYELQVQAYLACTGRAWGCMAVLVGGNELRLFDYERRPKTIDIIEAEVAAFWRSIAEDNPPKPDFSRDGAMIAKLYATVAPGKALDLSDSNRLPELIADYRRGSAQEKEGASIKSAAKAEILPLIGDAERVICGAATISAKTIAGSHIEYDRRAYRDFRIT
jgi:putative phage-type endonuclease